MIKRYRNWIFSSYKSVLRGLLASVLGITVVLSFNSDVFADNLMKPNFLNGSKTLTVCNSPGFPPLSYFEHPGDSSPIGSDIDLLQALAKEWGVELRLMLGEFAGLLPALESERCDLVMSGILVTPERQQKFDAVPYMKTSTLLLVSSGNDDIHDLDDMSGKILAIEAGTILERAAVEANNKMIASGKPEINLQTYPKAQDCIEQVLIGRADATLVQDTEAAFREKQMPGKLKAIFTLPESSEFGIYLRKNAEDTKAIKKTLEALKVSGFLSALPIKWYLPREAVDLIP